MFDLSHVPELDGILRAEQKRQREGLELIPSENYVSRGVLKMLGSEFTNKYSEGYPGKRYYGGQEYTDKIENLAIDYAKQLFNAKYVNVQPLSGSPANLAVYLGLLEPGDTILGLDLSHGGHLTHGHPLTVPAKLFNFVAYKTKVTNNGERHIDYEEMEALAKEHKPKLILAGFSSYTRDVEWGAIAAIAKKVNAYTMADVAHIAGLIAAGLKANPLDHGFDVMTTTTHKTLRGPRGGMILSNNEELMEVIAKKVFPGLQGGPHMNNIAAKAVAFAEALHPNFRTYGEQVLKNAKAMEFVFKGRKMPLVGNGTSNHMLVLDVWNNGKGVKGKEFEKTLDYIGITVNKNIIPDDPLTALSPSGIRLGTPAITSRGFIEEDCKKLAHIICDAYEATQTAEPLRDSLHKLKLEVLELSAAYPVPEAYC